MNLHGPVRAAEFEGTAQLVISFDGWTAGKVMPTIHEVTVLPPRKGAKSEPVTPRLLKTLAHPDRKASISDVRFSPDGKRMMITGYPSGVIQLFDTSSWKETVRIDTPPGLRGSSNYANPAPGWKTILVDVRTRKVVREEKGGKVLQRLQVDGRVDLYDAATGKLRDSIALKDRGPTQLFVVPDGKSVLVNAEGSFSATTRERPQSMEQLNLETKAAKKLFDSYALPVFSSDGQSAFLSQLRFLTTGKVNSAILKYDVAAGKVQKTVHSPDDQTFFDSLYLSPDGNWLVTSHRRLQPPSVSLIVLSPETLEEVARIPGPKDADRNTYFGSALFTPDSRLLVTRAIGGPLLIWDLAARKLARTVPVSAIEFGRMAISPDGKRVAIMGMPPYNFKAAGRDPDPYDLPQPRILLIDLANANSKPEVVMLPHGFVGGMAFSVDGKTMAVGSAGGCHLLDVSPTPKN